MVSLISVRDRTGAAESRRMQYSRWTRRASEKSWSGATRQIPVLGPALVGPAFGRGKSKGKGTRLALAFSPTEHESERVRSPTPIGSVNAVSLFYQLTLLTDGELVLAHENETDPGSEAASDAAGVLGIVADRVAGGGNAGHGADWPEPLPGAGGTEHGDRSRALFPRVVNGCPLPLKRLQHRWDLPFRD